MEFDNIIVDKPWGHEYILYENDNLAIWHLVIKPGFGTSFHSHPKKKTGLIIIDGRAVVSFMNDERVLNKFDKIIIRIGVFHKTFNIGTEDLHLLEVETPKDKGDILRLEDSYGRAGKPYEGKEYYRKNKKDIELIDEQTFKDIKLSLIEIESYEEIEKYDDYKVIILDGNIHMNGIQAAGVGDLLDEKTLFRLADKFETHFPLKLLVLQNESKQSNLF